MSITVQWKYSTMTESFFFSKIGFILVQILPNVRYIKLYTKNECSSNQILIKTHVPCLLVSIENEKAEQQIEK